MPFARVNDMSVAPVPIVGIAGTLYTRRTPDSIALNASESSRLSTPVGRPNDAPWKRTSTAGSFTTFFICSRNRSGSSSIISACAPGGAAHHSASRPSPWWSSMNITKVPFQRTKNDGPP